MISMTVFWTGVKNVDIKPVDMKSIDCHQNGSLTLLENNDTKKIL